MPGLHLISSCGEERLLVVASSHVGRGDARGLATPQKTVEHESQGCESFFEAPIEGLIRLRHSFNAGPA